MALNGGKGTLQQELVPKRLVGSQRQQGEEQIKAWEREIKAEEEGERWRGDKGNVVRHSSKISCFWKAELRPLPVCYNTSGSTADWNRAQGDGPEAGLLPEICVNIMVSAPVISPLDVGTVPAAHAETSMKNQ